ncbi:tape measure protein [Thauera sp.]|uniref:tape measure protein n=1 Tax=Thauera sp. TaxID=1905334 RepID=UPI0039E68FAD
MASTNQSISLRISANGAEAVREMQRFGQSVGDVKNRIDQTAHATSALTASMARMGHFTAGLLGFRELSQAADAYGQYASRMRIATDSTEEYEQAQRRMVSSANETYRSINETRESFIQMSPVLRQMGLSLNESIDAIDTFSGLLVVNAASAERGAQAQAALSKALQAGRVDVDTWQTLLSAMPSVVSLLAESSGMAEAEIRKLGISGKLSVEMLTQALVSGNETVMAQVRGMPTALADALTLLNTAFSEFVGYADEVSGVTAALVKGIVALAEHFNVLAAGAMGVAAVLGGRFVGAQYAAVRATVERIQAERAAKVAAAESAAAEARRALVAQEAALAAQAAARAKSAAVQLEVAADRERVLSAGLAAEQEIAARQAQFAATASIIRQEIALEKQRLAAQINDVGRAARLRELAALSQQLQAAERGAAAQASALAAQRVANEQAVAQAATAGAAKIAAARRLETTATEAAGAATLKLRGMQAAAQGAATATGLAATATAAFGTAVAALGGPVGALITVLSLAGIAWSMFGSRAESAGEKAAKAAERVEEAKRRIDREKKFGAGDAADFREAIAHLEALVARDEALLKANEAQPDESFMAGAVAARAAQSRALLEENRKYLAEIEAQEGAVAAGLANLRGAAWTKFMDNGAFDTEAQKDLRKFEELARGYAEAVAEIQKAQPGVDPLSTSEGIQALARYQGKLKELQGEFNKTALAAQERLRTPLVDAIKAGTEEAKRLKSEIADLLAQAANIRAGVAGAGAKAQERRDRMLSPEEREATNRQRANDALSEATRYSTWAQNAALDGRAEKAQQYAQRAAELIKQASAAADRLTDDADAAEIFDRVAEAEASALEAQAKAKEKELAAKEAGIAKLRTELSEIEGRIVQLKADAAALKVNADTKDAKTALDGVKTAVDAIPAEKTVTIKTVTESGVTFSDAAGVPGFSIGGWTGPGSKYQAAGIVHAEEFVNRREVVRQPGARPFLELFNRFGMRALDIWRNGYAQGGLVRAASRIGAAGSAFGSALSSLAVPNMAAMGMAPAAMTAAAAASPAASAGTPVVLDFGQLGRYSTTAQDDVAEQIVRTFQMAALQRGRRR